MVDMLIRCRGNVNAIDKVCSFICCLLIYSLYVNVYNGCTPLHLAATNNHTLVVEKLVNFRAPVNSIEEVYTYTDICIETANYFS